MQVTRFRDVGAWETAQHDLSGDQGALVTEERVRLLRSVASRPRENIPWEDRRPVYGYRRFFISSDDLDEFVHCSEEGVWPRIEAQGACILGLWATVAATSPLEVVRLHADRAIDFGRLVAHPDYLAAGDQKVLVT